VSIFSVPMSSDVRVLYTLLGGVRSEADVARFYYTNKTNRSRY
jgi:hypothetical protein